MTCPPYCAGEYMKRSAEDKAKVLWQKFEAARETRADANGAEVAAVGGQQPVDLASLGNSGDRAVNQSEMKLFELCIELKSPNKIGGDGQFVFVPGTRVEDLGDQFAHRRPAISEKVVDFGEDQRGHDDETCRSQNGLVFRKAGLKIACAGECAEQPACVEVRWL